MTKRIRKTADVRKQELLDVAIKLAEKIGYHKITQHALAKAAKVSLNLPVHYFGSMAGLRAAIMQAAIKQENVSIIAQGIGNQDVNAHKASDLLKNKAVQYLTN